MEEESVKKVKSFGIITYTLAVLTVFILTVIHLFGLFRLNADKFAFFLISILVLLLLIPLATYITFFNLIEVRKDTRIMEKK